MESEANSVSGKQKEAEMSNSVYTTADLLGLSDVLLDLQKDGTYRRLQVHIFEWSRKFAGYCNITAVGEDGSSVCFHLPAGEMVLVSA